jgi:hypothetical protein
MRLLTLKGLKIVSLQFPPKGIVSSSPLDWVLVYFSTFTVSRARRVAIGLSYIGQNNKARMHRQGRSFTSQFFWSA